MRCSHFGQATIASEISGGISTANCWLQAGQAVLTVGVLSCTSGAGSGVVTGCASAGGGLAIVMLSGNCTAPALAFSAGSDSVTGGVVVAGSALTESHPLHTITAVGESFATFTNSPTPTHTRN